MDKVSYYERQQYCCNPHELANHKSTIGTTRYVNENNIEALKKYGIDWVTKKMHLCTACRLKLSNKDVQIQGHISGEQKEPFLEGSPLTTTSSSSTTTPSSGDSIKHVYNKEQIDALVKFLKISIPEKASRFDATSSNYRTNTVKETYNMILNTIKSMFPSEITDDVEDTTQLVSNINAAFQATNDTKKKIELVNLMPQNWPFLKIEAAINGVTRHMITRAKSHVPGITSLVKTGRPTHASNVQQKVITFYLQDDVTRPFPGLKDNISIKLPDGKRQKFQKRLLLAPLAELHNKYLESCTTEQEKISLTSFRNFRPKQCVFTGDSSALNVCVCIIHENTKFFIEALKKTECFQNEQTDLLNTLTEKMICQENSEACFLRTCGNCDSSSMVDYVAERLDEKNIENIKLSYWTTTPRCEVTSQDFHIDDFLDCLGRQLQKFIVHKFKVEKQNNFIKMKKSTLIPKKEIICQMDFAENYACVTQDSIQSSYFNKPQVTIHPFVIFYKDEAYENKCLNIVAISAIRTHNTITVYAFQKKLISILKEKFPDLEKIIYLSDGCAEQYKNKSNFKNVCCHERDFGLKAEWHFFPTSHGKGPCDGIGGIIKRMARDDSIRKTAVINNAEHFYEWASSDKIQGRFQKDWDFLYIPQENFDDAKTELCGRLADLLPIAGTQKYHQFIPKDEHHIYVSEYSDHVENLEENLTSFSLIKKRKSQNEAVLSRSKRVRAALEEDI